MSSASLRALCGAALAALSACSGQVAAEFAPAPQAMAPRGGLASQAATARVSGRFYLTGTERIGRNGGVAVDLGFRAALDGVPLEGVVWVGPGELQVQVPAGLALGPHALTVTAPSGMTGTLADAWTASDRLPAQLAAAVALPARVSTGQQFAADFTISDPGGTDAQGVGLQVSTAGAAAAVGALPAAQTVPAGGSQPFRALLVAGAPGSLAVTGTAAGSDAVSGLPVQGSASGTLLVESAPSLSGLPGPVPAAVSVGQPLDLLLEVTNSGAAGVLALAPAPPVAEGGGALRVVSLPAPQDVPGGATRTFRFGCVAESPGAVALTASGAGQDENGAGPVLLPPVRWGPLQVLAAAALAASAAPPPARASVGQAIGLSLAVTNRGGATARGVLPALSQAGSGALRVAAAPPAQDVSGGATASFAWTLVAQAAGTVSLAIAVAGSDALSGAPLALSLDAGGVLVQAPPALSGVLAASPSTVSLGQPIQLRLDVSNGGEVAALGFRPQAAAAPGGALGDASPPAQDVPAGATVRFTWSAGAQAPGTLGFTAAGSGADANGAGPVAMPPAAAGPVLAMAPAALSAALSAPAAVDVGQAFTVGLSVQNTGGAPALQVTPGAPVASPSGLVALSAGPAPASATIAPGASQQFTWTFTGAAPGAVSLSAGAQGVDANSGVAATAQAAAAGTLVQRRAALAAVAAADRTVLEIGQQLTFTLTATNGGEAPALSVSPGPLVLREISGSGVAAVVTGPSPASATLAGGQSQAFTWTVQGASPGTFAAGASLTGRDANDGSALGAGPVEAAEVQVQSPPSLAATAALSSAAVSVGQEFTVALQVTNAGGTTAAGLQPALAPPCSGAVVESAPAARDLAGGASTTFTWSLRALAPGTCSFAASASGTDANTLAPLSAGASAGPLQLQAPAALAATLQAARAAADLGQAVPLVLHVTNTGDAPAMEVAPALAASPGGAAALSAPQPATATIAGGASVDFTWTLTPAAAGTIGLAATASGCDANTQAVVTAGASAALLAQRRAALSGTLAAPAEVSVGQTFTVTLTVANAGDAAAIAVAPSALAVAGAAGGAASLVSGPSPAAADLAGGASAGFTWTLQATGVGSLSLHASAAGADANDGSVVSAAPAGASSAVGVVSLSGAVAWSAATVSVGQTVTVTLTVTNSGATDAKDVLPGTPVLTGTAGLTPSGAAPGSSSIGAGATKSYTWTYAATAPGTVTFTAGAAGTDKNTGLPTLAPPATSPLLTVQTPAALTASLAPSPATDDLGDVFTVTLTVTNSGQAATTGVQPSGFSVTPGSAAQKLSGPTPAQAAIAGLGSQAFTWTFRAQQTGAVTFTSGAKGKDANSNLDVTAAAASGTALLQTAAALTGAFAVPAGPIDSGDPLPVTLTVSNSGDSAASGVAPSALTRSSGSATCPGSPSPASATVPGHGSASFTWACTAATPGSVTFTAAASGADAVDGAAVTAAPTTSAAVTVQTPAALSAVLTLPATADGSFLASLTLTNTGGAAASGVFPGSPVPSGANTGSAYSSSGPTPPSAVTLAAGASQTFTWTYVTTTYGSFALSVSASGTDATDGRSLSASAGASTTLAGLPALVEILASPGFPGSRSTSFAYVLGYQGQVWLGPSGDGSGAVHVNPDGSSPQSTGWQPEVDRVSGYVARNTAFQGGSPPACLTLGYTGCPPSSTACGPDNEGGRGLLFSGTLGGAEWLLASGARSSGGTRFLYANQPGNLVNGRLDLFYLDLVAGVTSTTTAATAALAYNPHVYLGLSDTGTATGAPVAPVLLDVRSLPATSPGLNANSGSTTDLVNLQARWMPFLGVDGGTGQRNPLRGISGATVLVDAVASFGTPPDDALYVANNGGWLRSTRSAPGPCTAPGVCPDWVVVSPTASAFGNRTAVSVFGQTADFEPADKAVPAIVPFGGRLFAARNTLAGPQLWSCNPTGNNPGGAANTQCDPGDWALVAPNTAQVFPYVDGSLTQMQNPNNTAITLLAAVAGYLYVGYNNSNEGVQLYRTQNPGVSNRSEFNGTACNNGTLPCNGIGGAGLGAGASRIFDSRALTFAGSTALYLTAGTGSSPIGLFRVNP